MEPSRFRVIRDHLTTMTSLRPCSIVVTEESEDVVWQVLRQLPRSLGVVPRSFRNIAYTGTDDELVLLSRSWLNY